MHYSFLKNSLISFLQSYPAKKKLIIINSYDKTQMIARVIKECLNYLNPETRILCFKSRIPEEFRDFRDIVAISEDYLADEDYLAIDEYVFKDISKNWDRQVKETFKDIFTYRNVELARIAEYNFQLFLIAKLKALVVINRAIKDVNYQAIFIIDSNQELENFDRLLSGLYNISTDFIRLTDKESLVDITRRRISSNVSVLLDNFASLLIQKKNR